MTELLAKPFADWHPLLFILFAGAIPTQMWRWLGVFLSVSLDEDSEILRWVKAVATALVAGLIANLVIYPSGVLADLPLWLRLGALAFGYGVYLVHRGHIIWGILAGESVLLLGALLLS